MLRVFQILLVAWCCGLSWPVNAHKDREDHRHYGDWTKFCKKGVCHIGARVTRREAEDQTIAVVFVRSTDCKQNDLKVSLILPDYGVKDQGITLRVDRRHYDHLRVDRCGDGACTALNETVDKDLRSLLNSGNKLFLTARYTEGKFFRVYILLKDLDKALMCQKKK